MAHSGSSLFFLLSLAIAISAMAEASSSQQRQRPKFVVSRTPLRTASMMMPNMMGPMYDGDDWIYFVGTEPSNNPSTTVFRYSISKDTTEKGGYWPPEFMPVPSPQGNAGFLDGNGDIISFAMGAPGPDGQTYDVWRVHALNTSDRSVLGFLPFVLPSSTVAWDGNKLVYIFGGTRNTGMEDDIFRFSLITNTMERVGKLPHEVKRPNVVFDDQSHTAYLFGGDTSSYGPPSAGIIKFDAASGQAATANVSLYYPNSGSCTVWIGTQAYIIGGSTIFPVPNPDLNAPMPITRFTPGTNQLELVFVDGFPRKIQDHSCVYVESVNRIYMFGGMMEPHVPYMGMGVMYIDLKPEGDD